MIISKVKQFSLLFSILCIGSNPFLAAALSPQPPSGITVNTTKHTFDQPVDIPSNTNSIAEISFDIQGLEGVIWDIDVETFIQHVSPKVLTITLESPSGEKTVLMSEAGKKITQKQDFINQSGYTPLQQPPPNALPDSYDFGNNFNTNFSNQVLNGTLWDDQSPLPVTEVEYSITNQSHQATLAPEGALAAFNGKNPNGTWKLTIQSSKPSSLVEGWYVWFWQEKFDPFIVIGPCHMYETVDELCEVKANQYVWGSLECSPVAPQYINDDCQGNVVELTVFSKIDYTLSSPHYVKSYKEYGDAQNITNCSLIITTASGSHPIKWASIGTNLNQNIVNNSLVNSILTITNQGQNLKELELYTDIDHNQSGDLRISLTSPSGTTAFLTANNGGSKNNVFTNTFWDDQAVTPATDAIYQNNTAKRALIPEGTLALFRAENPNGNWTLNILDEDGNPNSLGTLNQWGLRLTTYVEPKPSLIISPPPPAPSGITLQVNTFTNNESPKIQNFTPLAIPFEVSGLVGPVWDVDLAAFIQHPSVKDLTISLISPDGKTAVLSSENGFQRGPFPENYFPQSFVLDYNENDPPNVIPPFLFDNFILPAYSSLLSGVCWSDQSPTPITDADYSADLPLSNVAPEGALDIFRGINPNGQWLLSIQDNRDNQTIWGVSKWFNKQIIEMKKFITEGSVTNCFLQLTLARGEAEMKTRSLTNIVNLPIENAISSEMPISGLGNVIEQVKVYTKISHPQCGALDLTLTSPSGKKAVLSTGNGGNLANIFNGTLWDDRASTDLRVTDFNFNNDEPQPLLIPEGALAIFRGENPNGVWKLNVSDKQAVGTLEEWGLIITSYFASLPPIVHIPPPFPPPPASAYSKGDAPLFGQKGKRAYILVQKNGVALEAPKALAELKPKYKIVAANYFSTVNNTNPSLYLILQHKTELSSKVVAVDGGSLTDGDLFLDSLSDRKDKIVASGDLNQDGYNDLIIQGRHKSVKVLNGPDFTSPFTLSNDFRKVGKVVGVVNNRILTRKKNLLYATSISIGESNRIIPSEILANGLTPKLKICGVADLLETPGLELILQQGKRIGHGPLNLNGPFGFIFTNRSDLTLGIAVGPK